MFRCKECGNEFDIKPDYCDCGNDTFEEIVEKVETVTEEEPINNENMWVEENGFGYPINEEEYENLQKQRDKNKQKSEPVIKFEKPNLPQIKIEPISLAIFLICILLSIFVIFFVGNPKEDMVTDKNTEISQTTGQNIPSIDKIWDNTLPVKKIEETEVLNIKSTVDPQYDQDELPIEVKKNESKHVQNVQKNPVNIVPKQVKQTSSQSIQIQQKQSKPVQTQIKTNTTSSASKPIPIKTQPASLQNVKPVNPQEMFNYKIALRNKLASKIDFTSILGDGTCVVSFKVSPSGTLTNRTFVKQSDNGILNDIVYNAIMSTPTFNSPPSSYNNETLKFTVKMYDGRYEVSLN